MQSTPKTSLLKQLRPIQQITYNFNDKSFQRKIQKQKIYESIAKLNMKNSAPLYLNSIKQPSFLQRKQSIEFPLNIRKVISQRKLLINSNSQVEQNSIFSVKSVQTKVTNDSRILENNQKQFLIDIEQKQTQNTNRKTEKINFINDKISKLKNINDKLISLKDQILAQLAQDKAPVHSFLKQYYIGDLIFTTPQGNSFVQKNSAHFTHFINNFKILKHLQSKHHTLSRPPSCQKTIQPPLMIQVLPILVLDLDETLVWTEKTDKLIVMNSIYLKDKKTGRNVRHEVHLRPHVNKFLQQVSKMYEVVIFTAGCYEYTSQVVKMLDSKRKFISRILTRQHATKLSDDKYEIYVKDLRVLGKSLNRIVFVDNSIYSYALQLQNGIPILPFNGDPTDSVLQDLLVYLKELSQFTNLMERNEEIFKQTHFHRFFNKKISIQEVLKSLYQNDKTLKRNNFYNERS